MLLGVLSVRTSWTTWSTVRTSVSLRRSAQVLRSAGLLGCDQSAVLAGSWRHDSSVMTSLPWWDSRVGGSILGGAPPLLTSFGVFSPGAERVVVSASSWDSLSGVIHSRPDHLFLRSGSNSELKSPFSTSGTSFGMYETPGSALRPWLSIVNWPMRPVFGFMLGSTLSTSTFGPEMSGACAFSCSLNFAGGRL